MVLATAWHSVRRDVSVRSFAGHDLLAHNARQYHHPLTCRVVNGLIVTGNHEPSRPCVSVTCNGSNGHNRTLFRIIEEGANLILPAGIGPHRDGLLRPDCPAQRSDLNSHNPHNCRPMISLPVDCEILPSHLDSSKPNGAFRISLLSGRLIACFSLSHHDSS